MRRADRDAAVIVAPRDGRWASLAYNALRDAHVPVARVEDMRYAGLLIVAGGARAALIDSRLLGPAAADLIARWRAARPSIAIVIVGETSAATEARRALESGGGAYLPWPFEASDLLHVLRPALKP